MKGVKICSGLLLMVALIFVGCATTDQTHRSTTSSSNEKMKNKVSSDEYLSLEDYLRRLNGVQVSGSPPNLRVRIRSTMSISHINEQPLYIINGQEIGRSYARAAQYVEKGNIKSVEAIPPSRATSYGSRGSAGVIVIETK